MTSAGNARRISRRRWAALSLVAVPFVAAGLATWLAPTWTWSLRAWAFPADLDAAWEHVAPSEPFVARVDSQVLSSAAIRPHAGPVVARMRDHGLEVDISNPGAGQVVLTGWPPSRALAVGVRAAPSHLVTEGSSWHGHATLRGAVTNARVVLRPLAPGIVEATRASELPPDPSSTFDWDGLPARGAVSARWTSAPETRASLARVLSAPLRHLARSLVVAEAEIHVDDAVELHLRLEHESEATAVRTERVGRRWATAPPDDEPGLIRLMFGRVAEQVQGLQLIAVERNDSTVEATFVVPPESLVRALVSVLPEQERERRPGS